MPSYSSRAPGEASLWFERAIHPNRRNLRRGGKRAVFIDDAIAKR
jgi:hypothetical protein